MKMIFIFDKDKLEKEKYKEEQCFAAIRKHFDSYRSSTIKEVQKGVYEGAEEDWGAFASSVKFTYTKWFLKVIKEWYWYVDEGDGLGEQRQDCLKSYYELKDVNT